MIDAPLALAFTAGLVATVNPCGFVMLPAYLSWFIGTDGDSERADAVARVGRALAVSSVVSATFLVVFTVTGLLFSVGAVVVVEVIPWLALAVGGGVVALGVAMWRGWKPAVALPQPSLGVRSRGAGGAMLFGVSYAVASLSCTLPVFLAVVAGTVTSRDVASGVATYVAYGAGMSLVLVAVAVAVAAARTAFVTRLRMASRRIDRAAAMLLVVAGLYVMGYWAFTLAVPPGSDGPGWARLAEVPVRAVERVSSWSVNAVEPSAPLIALVLSATVGAAGLAIARARSVRARTGARSERACSAAAGHTDR
ncbi:MAG: cytochrome c biogenesis CcdA family protein [Acidimicrobiales bacterium]